jgi:hypothetical protein
MARSAGPYRMAQDRAKNGLVAPEEQAVAPDLEGRRLPTEVVLARTHYPGRMLRQKVAATVFATKDLSG